MTAPLRIAMWSGPRNISTALMYSFAQRPDCAVTDEPFYAAFLAATGAPHPMRDEVLRHQPTDPKAVIAHITGPVPGGRPLWYQKHMAHHMVPEFDLSWTAGFANVFLIRHPARVIRSYAARREAFEAADLGFAQLHRLFDHIAERTGKVPLVVDSADIRRDPGNTLALLCQALGIVWDARMLRWPAGGNAADGVWARHWYGSVHRSTGFSGAEGPLPPLDPRFAPILKTALPHYEALSMHAIGREGVA